MTNLANKTVIVIGAGRAGAASSRLLVERGARVRLLEKNPAGIARELIDIGVVVSGDENADALDAADLVVPSPGVARSHPLLRAAVERGIAVWSEVELAARFLSCPIVAITGTNGKSTTTVLVGNILREAGHHVFVGGNLGTPLAAAVSHDEAYDYAVVEVSSFQLEWLDSFRPRVAVWLNLTADHLDRYDGLADYEDAKAALLRQLGADGVAVVNRDDPRVWARRADCAGELFSFGLDPVAHGVYFDSGAAVVRRGGESRVALGGRPLRGAHNSENMMAALAVAAVLEVPMDAVDRAFDATANLPHRLQFVGEKAGAQYYDDSKATNIGAVEKSIASFDSPIILLLGGYDKGSDFRSLRESVAERVERVVCFGAAGPQIASQLAGAVHCEIVEGVADAVRSAAARARPGQSVVLAPGCASFDEFRDYADRGRQYRAMVDRL